MINEKETRERLLISAKAEFMEKGYLQASLRTICKNAGVTTGALYFFFRDKEDLFACLVEEPLETLFQVMHQHYLVELQTDNVTEFLSGDFSTDLDAARQLISFMYQNHDAFQLILQKSQGSKFEDCIDRFVAVSENHYRIMADKVTQKMGLKRIDDFMVHWVSHMLIDSFVYLLSHEKSEEAALKSIEPMVRFMINGWLVMFRASNEEG